MPHFRFCFTSIAAVTFLSSLAGPGLAYDDTWHQTDFWAGEYPAGFSMQQDAVTTIRTEPNPNVPRSIQCELKKNATYHTWNQKRAKSDKLEFITFVPITKYRTKKAGTVDVHDEKTKKEVKLNLKAGDEWTFLTYYGEGFFPDVV